MTGIPNVGSPGCGKILSLTEDNVVIQFADVPLQLLLHHAEAGNQNFLMAS